MTDWPRLTLFQAIERAAAAWPELEASVVDGKRIRHGAVAAEARRIAAGLLALGVRKGDHIAVCTGNRLEWMTFFYGAALIGAVTVPVNTRFKAEELRYCLSQSDSTLLLVADRFLKVDFIAMLRAIAPGIDGTLPDPALPRLRTVIVLGDDVPAGALPYAALLAAGDAAVAGFDPARQPVDPDDPVLIQYTSGSTSFPKGAVLTHDGMLRNAWHVANRIGLTVGDRYFSARPYFHVAGTTLSMLASLVQGACLVTLPVFETGAALKLLADERCTLASGNEPIFLMMLNHPDIGKYTYALRGGWAIGSRDTLQNAMDRLGMRFVCQGYGLSEASPNVWMNAWQDPPEVRFAGLGIPHAGLEVRIVDLETGREQPPGVPGEIRVRGWSVMKGYYNMPERTAETIDADGWLHTGDLGAAEGNGRVRFVARAKEMVRVGGENVAPADVESVLNSHPQVKHAEIVGVPDRRLEEVVAAYVILNEGATITEAELIAWCKDRMAGFKVPRYLRFVDSFEPIGMTASAKVQKNRLRADALKAFGLEELPGRG